MAFIYLGGRFPLNENHFILFLHELKKTGYVLFEQRATFLRKKMPLDRMIT